MRISRVWLCAFFFALASMVCGAAAVTAEAHASRGEREFAHEPILVVEPARWLFGYAQEQAQAQAHHVSPQAVAARSASKMQFAGLDSRQAAELARTSFPALVARRDGGLPKAPRGGRLGRIVGDHAVSVVLADGKHGVVESLVPISTETGAGRVPIDLGLHEADGHFTPKAPAAGLDLTISKNLSDGTALRDAGVSLVPVDDHGVPLSSAGGVIDGATVFYGDSERSSAGVVDMDTVVKPETLGFSEDAVLRSERSPDRLSFEVGMPSGAHLVHHRGASSVLVVSGGRSIAKIAAPTAVDAEGTQVPLTVGFSGSVVTVSLERQAGQYKFPIAVDPAVTDYKLNASGSWRPNWHFATNGSWYGMENSGGAGWTEYIPGWRSETTYGAFQYTTQGASSIEDVNIQPYWNDTGANISNELLIVGSNSAIEAVEYMPAADSSGAWWSRCAPEFECGSRPPSTTNNSAEWGQFSTAAGNGTGGENTLAQATVEITQASGPTAYFDTTDPEVGGVPNAMYGSNWLGRGTAVEFVVEDPGVGVWQTTAEYQNKPTEAWQSLWTKKLSTEGFCSGVQCPMRRVEFITYNSLLADGPDNVGMMGQDSANVWTSAVRHAVNVDGTAPHGILISGLPAGNLFGLKTYTLKAEATDGSGSVVSSGVKSIALTLDGSPVGVASGSCTPGPCTAHSGSWTIDGRALAGGEHKLVVTATDYAGNSASETVTMTSPVAHPVAVGPGEVSPRSGEFSLQQTDVSQGEGLTVSRSYASQHLYAGSMYTGIGGPVGYQWALSIGNMEDLEAQSDGSVVLTDSSGRRVSFTKSESGGFSSPSGDANQVLSFNEAAKEYVLTNPAKGTNTRFTPSASGSKSWLPTVHEGAVSTETTTYTYETAEVTIYKWKIVRPKMALAPVPAGVSCAPELKPGCRALTFNYATSTTATGEGPSEWGDSEGNLTRVYLTAYDPSSKAMSTVTVAQYAYDKKARLRAEWDPRISPALKTEYGYDSEGHVTALTPPGQESWAFVYGTIPGDADAGRLLRATRAPASASLWGGTAPANTTAPALTPEQPSTEVSEKVSAGSWNGSPVAYDYQWLRCSVAGTECAQIPGADNEAYKPTAIDLGHSLKVEVQAINGGGSTTAYTAAAPVVRIPTYSSKFGSSGTGNGQFKYSYGSAIDSSGNVWVVDTGNNRVEEFSSSGTYLSQFGSAGTENGQFKEAAGIAVTPEGNLWVADSGNNRLEEFSSSGVYIRQVGTYGTGNGQFYDPWGIAVDASGNLWVTDSGNGRVQELSSTGVYIRQFGTHGYEGLNGQFWQPTGIGINGQGDIWVVDVSAKNAQEFSPTGSYMARFGSSGTGNGQFGTPWALAIDSSGNIWIGDEGNKNVQEFSSTGQFITKFGSSGTGNGQFKSPDWISVSSSGTIYVSDTGNHRVQMFTTSVPAPSYSSKFGSSGTGNGQFKYVYGTAIDSSGNVWVVDEGNSRVEEFSSSGTYLSQFGSAGTGNGQFKEAIGIAVTPEGNLWVTDSGNNRLEEFSSSGVYIRQVGTYGTGNGQFYYPWGIAVDASGDLWVTDMDNGRVQELSSTGAFIRQVGTHGYEGLNGQFGQPTGIGVTPQGNIWVADVAEDDVQEFSPTGSYMARFGSSGSGNGQFYTAWALAVDSSGDIWIGDEGNKDVQEFSSTGQFITKFGSSGTGNGQFKAPGGIAVSSSGTIYVSDAYNNRVQTFTKQPESTSEAAAAPSQTGSMTTVEYNVPVSGTGAPYEMSSTEVAKWGQADDPSEAMAVFPPDEPVGWPAADYRRATVLYLDERARAVNVSTPAGGISTSEYNEANDLVRELSPDNRATALAEGAKSVEASHKLDVESTYSSDGTELLSTLGPSHTVKLTSGEEVAARQHTVYSYDEGAPGGGTYRLVTKVAEGAQVEGREEQNVRTTTRSYAGQSNLGWTLRSPTSVTTDPSGLKLTSTFVYDATTGNVLESRKPGSGGEGNPHDVKTVYYSVAANPTYPACGGHPEWANLTCKTMPGAQPETAGVPNLPVTTTTYNVWLEPATMSQVVGGDTRETTNVYDAGGRPTKSSISSTVGTSLPAVTAEYESSTGLVNATKTTVEGVTTSLAESYDTLGELKTYTDADGVVSSYEYDVDGRVISANDGKGTQTYKYSRTNGLESELVDSAVGRLTATYDVEGNQLTETAPDGIKTAVVYGPTGEAIELEDTKETSCGTSCTWFSDTEVPTIHDQMASESNTLAQDGYKYDEAGRLTEVTETPSGEGCSTRVYGFDAEDNRTSLTSRGPAAEGKCATSGGTVNGHSYDSGNRLTDAGVKYDSFGDTTVMPGADAGGSELLSAYYSDSKLASVSQAGQTVSYKLDPARRTRETVSTGTISSTVVSHYMAGSESPSWTVDLAGKWTRYIQGIAGGLIAIQYNGEAPVMQLSDFRDNVVATASNSATATSLLSDTRSTEYGVPTTSAPAKYSWLGVEQRPTELSSGVVAMGARGYVPQLGRFLQSDPLAGGSANPYGYTDGDPVNSTDLTGGYVESGYLAQFNEEEKERAIERRIAEEEAAREEAERKAEEAAQEAQAPGRRASGGGGGGRNGHGQGGSQGGMATASMTTGGSARGHTHWERCIDFRPIGGPLVGMGSNCLKVTGGPEEPTIQWVEKNKTLKAVVKTGTEIYKSISEAAKASGVEWKDLKEALEALVEVL